MQEGPAFSLRLPVPGGTQHLPNAPQRRAGGGNSYARAVTPGLLAEGRTGYRSLFLFMGWQRSCSLKEAAVVEAG